MIDYQCACGHEYSLKDELAGQQVQCYACGKTLTAPKITVGVNKLQTPSIPRLTQLPAMKELLKKSWEIYKNRIPTLILTALTALLLLALSFIFIGSGFFVKNYLPDQKNTIMLIGMCLTLLSAFYFTGWSMSAYYQAITEPTIGLKESFVRSRKKIGAFLWFTVLFAFLIGGAQLLLFIPGIIFTVWFFFVPFVIIKEETYGMNAFLKSKEYVKGLWWPVAWRLFAVWFISFLISAIPIIGQILALLIVPYAIIHASLIYEALKSIKGEILFVPTFKAKAKICSVSLLGFLFIPLIFIMFFGSMLAGMFLMLKSQIKNFGAIQQPPPIVGSSVPMPDQGKFSPLIERYNTSLRNTGFWKEWRETEIEGIRIAFTTDSVLAGPFDPDQTMLSEPYLIRATPNTPLPDQGEPTRLDQFVPKEAAQLVSQYYLGAYRSAEYPVLKIKEVWQSLPMLSTAVEQVMIFSNDKGIQLQYNFSQSNEQSLDSDLQLLIKMARVLPEPAKITP